MTVRALRAGDRAGLADLLAAIDVFTAEEQRVALDIIDLAAAQPDQRDYTIGLVEDGAGGLAGYACYGPTPLTDGTYDLYWMAVAPGRRLTASKGQV